MDKDEESLRKVMEEYPIGSLERFIILQIIGFMEKEDSQELPAL
jgi:hypothetical protein